MSEAKGPNWLYFPDKLHKHLGVVLIYFYDLASPTFLARLGEKQLVLYDRRRAKNTDRQSKKVDSREDVQYSQEINDIYI